MDAKLAMWFCSIRFAIIESQMSDEDKFSAIDETFRMAELLNR